MCIRGTRGVGALFFRFRESLPKKKPCLRTLLLMGDFPKIGGPQYRLYYILILYSPYYGDPQKGIPNLGNPYPARGLGNGTGPIGPATEAPGALKGSGKPWELGGLGLRV